MKNLTWQNPEQLFVAQELINKVKSKCCGIKEYNDEIIANFNITTIADHYEKYWTTGLNIANNDIYYRVSFDLVSSTDGKTYSFSKYFKPKIVRRNFYPTDIFI